MKIVVVGIGADGVVGLDQARRRALDQADVLIGGRRQLAMLPEDLVGQRRQWPSPLLASLDSFLEELADRSVVALASGDPMFYGIGATLVQRLGSANVRILPGVSSQTLACSRMGWSSHDIDVVSAVGRDPHQVISRLAPGRQILVLSQDATTPGAVAEILVQAGYGLSVMTVLSQLGSPSEDSWTSVASELATMPTKGRPDIADLNVIAISCRRGGQGSACSHTPRLGLTAGLPDDAYQQDGQFTKRDLRASALARLAPLPGEFLWDVGAGTGTLAIEWMRSHPQCGAVAIESKPDRSGRIAANAASLGVPGLQVVTGQAPAALANLASPDAAFIGGGATTSGVIDTCWQALAPGGRLVVHGVTLETERVLFDQYDALGGELERISIEHAEALGQFTAWRPARAIVQWSVSKPEREPNG